MTDTTRLIDGWLSLPCTSKHELFALLQSGWKLTLVDARDWTLESEKGTKISVYPDDVLEVAKIVNMTTHPPTNHTHSA